MERIYFSFPGDEQLADRLTSRNKAVRGVMEVRRFPDGESYVRIDSDVYAKKVVLVCRLEKPDEKIMSIYFFSQIAKSLNAATITLVVPYLPYMRQDKLFNEGEGITSVAFAQLLSSMVDEIVTIDPHLHRFHTLKELYSITTIVITATKSIADWINENVNNPFIIGPDNESEQWVKQVAQKCKAPYNFLNKTRHGDKCVEIVIPEKPDLKGKTPVLVDDIISSGKTMVEAVKQLKNTGIDAPLCIGVHGIFSGNAYEELKNAGASDVITTNTILHPSNRIDITDLL